MNSFYVTDTQAIIHYMEDRKPISKKINDIFEDADKGNATIYIPAIVLMEILYLFEKKRVKINIPDLKRIIQESFNYIEQELNLDIIEEAVKIDDIPELHDRIIAATAKYLESPLLTNDPVILKSKHCKTIY